MRIEMLSRFRTDKEQKKTLEELEAGKVDVVIGTHRLLSKDVKFHDLGLLVVDEEQRFGVAHKERLKEMRKNVDVLTMSATPIPRTLHMSLVGLRDMSVIETPPKDRLAIQTTVAPFSETLVQRVIEEEMAREGQVFFVHNRVESIASLASMVKRLVPRARVVVGHGQMRESELEKVMLKFVRNEADVLVSTTIIENGLDIPRANTILINRADRMGLSELYQLRGRVGRSNQRAYAYLLVPNEGDADADRAAAAGGAAGIQRPWRRVPDRRARFGVARGGESAGQRAARPHRSSRLRHVLPDDGARGGREERRSGQAGATGHAEPGAGNPHPTGIYRKREFAPANLQAHRERGVGSGTSGSAHAS